MEVTRDLKIETLGDGAVLEKLNYELQRAVENIMDINMEPGAVREVSLKIKIKPSLDSKQAAVSIQTDAKLASLIPHPTALFFTRDDAGKPKALEPNITQGELFDRDGNVIAMKENRK